MGKAKTTLTNSSRCQSSTGSSLELVHLFEKHMPASDPLLSLFDALPLQIAVLDRQGRYCYVNPAGVSDAEIRRWLIGRTDYAYCRRRKLPNRIARERKAAVLTAIQERRIVQLEECFPDRTRGDRILCRTYCPIATESEDAFCVIAFAEDVTEQRQVNHAHTALLAALEASLDGIALTNAEGEYIYVNPAYAAMYGYDSPEALLGTRWTGAYSEQQRLEFYESHLREFQKTGCWRGIMVAYRVEGAPFYQEVSLQRLETGDIFCICRDITSQQKAHEAMRQARDALERRVEERTKALTEANALLKKEIARRHQVEKTLRASEQRLAALFEFAPDAIYLHDLEGVFIDGNRAAERLCGYSRSELIGKSFLELPLLPPEQIGQAAALLKRSAAGEATEPDEFTLIRKDGKRLPIEIRTHPVDIDGERIIQGIVRDLSKRKALQSEIERQKHLFQQIADTAPIFIFVKDAGGRFLFVNKAMAESFNKPRDKIIGQHNAVVHRNPQEVELYLKTDAEVLQTKRVITVEETQTMPDGSVRYFQTTKSPLFVDDETVHVLGISMDITQVKEAERALQRQRYLAVVMQSADCILLIDVASRRVLEANPAFLNLLGYTAEEAKTLTAYDFVAHSREDIDEKIRIALREERFFLGQRWYRRKSGDLIPVEVNTSVIKHGGRDVFCVIARDISERLQAQQHLARSEKLLAEAERLAQMGSFEWDLLTETLTWSDELYRIFGLIPEHTELSIATFLQAVHEQDRAYVTQILTDLQEKGGAQELEERIRRPDGSVRVLASHFEVILDSAGRPIRMLGVCRDITAQRQAEAELRAVEAQMERAQKLDSLGVLAGGVAHDFNNLLTGVLGNVQLAQLCLPPNSEVTEYLVDIERAAMRAAELCRQLLAYAGSGRLVVRPVAVNEVVREVLPLIKYTIPASVRLQLDLAEALPPIESDAVQVQQMLMNLLTNAAEATSGAGEIRLKTELVSLDEGDLQRMYFADQAQPGLFVAVEVEDTGVGMDEETLARVFEPFFTTKFAGRGLGLAATLGILRSHHGAIEIASQPGAGTKVRVYFPALPAETALPSKDASAPRRAISQGTVLVVDDEKVVRDMSRRILSRMGFTVLVADGGRKAIELFRKHAQAIRLILLDLTMPGLSGEDTLRELLAEGCQVPVLLMSGYTEQEAFAHMEGLAHRGFVQKPFSLEALQDSVLRVLEQKQ